MRAFKVGDRVKMHWGEEGVIVQVLDSDNFLVVLDDHLGLGPLRYGFGILFRDGITQDTMNTDTQLPSLAKQLVDADTQALMEAGYLGSDLRLSNDGKRELWAIMFGEYRKQLVAVAKAAIKAKSPNA